MEDATKNTKPTYPTPLAKNESVLSKRTRISFSLSDRATKRVIAPYVRVVRKGQKIAVEKFEESKEFSFYLQKKPSVLMRNLTSFLSDSVDLPSLLHETAEVLKGVTKASGVTLYMVDIASDEIYESPRNVISDRHKVNWKMETRTTVAASVALNKEYIMTEDILADSRFPDGVGYRDPTIKAVLCVPVVTPDDECFAVIELYRDVTQPCFQREELRIVIVVTGWMGAAIHQNQQRLALQKQQQLNDYLLDLTKCYFADTVMMEKMISEVVAFAKVTLGAERGSFFVIDKDNDELVADLFDEGIDDTGEANLYKRNVKIRFNKERGIAGLVARTGVTVNIKDAYNDPRFNREVDQKTGFITRSILCMPVMGVDGILGVVQVINKKDAPCFTTVDENLFKTFSVYCALALHYSRLHTMMNATAKVNICFKDMLQFHMQPCVHDALLIGTNADPEALPEGFQEFPWYISPELVPDMPKLSLYMITEVVGESFVEINALMEFVLSVRKSYRCNPYHNFEHAFNVCHCMFNILKRNLDIFTAVELKALIIAALCHDLDHRGTTNNFLQLTNDTLVQLYEESPLENHHYLVTMTILHECKMFSSMTEGTFRSFSIEIKDAILATDLAMYFRSRSKLIPICHEGTFGWDNLTHRNLLKAIMMTCCDLSGQCKPYNVAKKITDNLYREFYHQGDIEKTMGLCPLSMMDRDKQHMVPEDQVQFLTVVVLPCAELLKVLLPNTEDLYTECLTLRNVWRQIIEFRGQKCWRQDDSLVDSDK